MPGGVAGVRLTAAPYADQTRVAHYLLCDRLAVSSAPCISSVSCAGSISARGRFGAPVNGSAEGALLVGPRLRLVEDVVALGMDPGLCQC